MHNSLVLSHQREEFLQKAVYQTLNLTELYLFLIYNHSLLFFFSLRTFFVSAERLTRLKSLTLAWPGGKIYHIFTVESFHLRTFSV